jgi:folylpolyglutamate synthase/dihydropteroate synthase
VRSHEPIAEPYGEKYEEAVKAAIGNAEEGDVICAQGSLYFVGIVREMLTQ